MTFCMPETKTFPPEPTLAEIPGAYEEVAALAYSYFELRAGQDGSADEDWLRAEAEILSRYRIHSPASPAEEPIHSS